MNVPDSPSVRQLAPPTSKERRKEDRGERREERGEGRERRERRMKKKRHKQTRWARRNGRAWQSHNAASKEAVMNGMRRQQAAWRVDSMVLSGGMLLLEVGHLKSRRISLRNPSRNIMVWYLELHVF